MISRFKNILELTHEIKDECDVLMTLKELSGTYDDFNYGRLNQLLQQSLSLVLDVVNSEHYDRLVEKTQIDDILDLIVDLHTTMEDK